MTKLIPRGAALLLLCAESVQGDMYDVLSPHLVPPEEGCKDWSDVPEMDQYWVAGKPPAGAGSSCAQQGRGNPNATWDSDMGSGAQAHVISAYCVGKSSGQLQMCTSGKGIPEQVNVQVASGSSVVLSFVTFEDHEPQDPPVAKLSVDGEKTTVKGVTHKHVTVGCTAGSIPGAKNKNHSLPPAPPTPIDCRVYYMHFIKVSDMKPKATYTYTVQSGGAGATVSKEFSFRAPYSEGVTKIALYGDMGVYTWNNMQNLYEDVIVNQTSDLIIHAGDHCYNEGDSDEKRADAYMQAFEQTVAQAPWMPIVGNHEFYAGTNLTRYLDSTWDEWGPLESTTEHEWGEDGLSGATSATSALGAMLSAGNHHGPGVHGAVPSKSSRYFSVDFGLTHLVGLSLNGYNGVDLCTTKCNEEQKEWLKQDLAAVDRSKTPWVIAMSHFPMYLAQHLQHNTKKGEATSPTDATRLSQEAWYIAEQCEYEGHSKDCKPKDWTPPPLLKDKQGAPITGGELEPIFMEYGVDIYWAGHIHFYETFDGPIYNGTVVGDSAVDGGLNNPEAVIHVCTGNGGPPSASKCPAGEPTDKNCIADPYSYTRLTAFNATDLLWEQISNKDSSVIDSWTVHQDKHGQFPIPPPSN